MVGIGYPITMNGGASIGLGAVSTEGDQLIAIGTDVSVAGGQSIAIGTGLNIKAGNAIAIGNSVPDVKDNYIHLGNSSIKWIGGQVNWSTYSDGRIKTNVQANVPGLAFIMKLNPVTYNLNIHTQNELQGVSSPDFEGKYDIEQITQTGFIAQEVEQAAEAANFDFNGVVKPADNNDLYSLRYAEFVVPLVKAVQEQQKEIEALKAEIEALKANK